MADRDTRRTPRQSRRPHALAVRDLSQVLDLERGPLGNDLERRVASHSGGRARDGALGSEEDPVVGGTVCVEEENGAGVDWGSAGVGRDG